MVRLRPALLALPICLLLGCNQKPSVDLCGCVSTAEYRVSGALSEACIEACMDTFGPELEGMESWFQVHCPEMENPLEEAPETLEI